MSEKLKVGVVGLNFGKQIIDDMILKGSASERFELFAVCATTAEKVKRFTDEYGCKGYVGLEALLEDTEIEVVVLMTGPNGRAEQIRKIIRADKHVMTTKPFEQDAAAAEAVLREARELGKVVYLNSPAAVSNRDFKQIRAWESKYDLGKLVGGHHECWYKSVEKADGSWYDDPAQCPAAPILRLGVYGLNDVMQLFGKPKSVQVMQTRHFTGRPTPDMARLSVLFEDGAMVDTLDGWVHQPMRGASSLILYYENGTVYRNPPLGFESMGGDAPKPPTRLCLQHKDDCGEITEEIALRPDELSSFYAWDALYEAVTTGERSADETPDAAIVNVIRVLEAVGRATRESHGFAEVHS